MNLEGVENFKYLGSTVTADNKVEEESKIRIASGVRSAGALNNILKSRIVSRKTKEQMYTTIIRPIVTYGGETWRLTKEQERRLLVFENGILRRIWGPVFDVEEGTWRRRHNEELKQLSEVPLITNFLRSQRLRWAGHVARMGDDRMAKGVMFRKPQGRRPLGRPRMRWMDNIRKDVELLGMEDPDRWWDVALDRGEWRELMRVARDHMGPEPAE